MNRIIIGITLSLLFAQAAICQQTDNLFERLQAIYNNGVTFYNVDGMEITSQTIDAAFTPGNISRKFNGVKIKAKELTAIDSTLDFPNFYVFKSTEKPKGTQQHVAYRFIEGRDKKTIAFTFGSVNKTDRDFERKFVRLVRDNAIPQRVFNSLTIDSIDFAGRKIPLGSGCDWMGVNNVQCPYFGQMNWSVHRTLQDASATANNQFVRIQSGNKGKIVSDASVNVIFEGTETTARRIVYDLTGVNSLLAGMSGGRTLTVYFVAAPVRKNFVSCVMSFWNNDQINPSGLSPLLEQVMKLK